MPRCRTAAALAMAWAGVAGASSHREAPFVTEHPKVDATDFYMFRSYEPGREGFVTIVANYVPLQDAYGGPNYFTMDPEALYEIHIDNNGDAVEDITFRFKFFTQNRNISLNIGGLLMPVPLVQVGPVTTPGDPDLNVVESFSAAMVRGDRRSFPAVPLTQAGTGEKFFFKPIDNIGSKTLPDYPGYAAQHVYTVKIPGCQTPGRLFVGQRKDPFVVNLGETFDLVNNNPLGPVNGETDDLADKSITSIILEVPIECLVAGDEPVIGGWTTASLPRSRTLTESPTFAKPATEFGPLVQVSRLGQPLVNEVVIGLADKDRFNASEPRDDGQFAAYVTNPTLPALLNSLFGVRAPCLPRNDLVSVFLTGLDGLNQPANVTPSEMLRLNTGIAPTPLALQSPLGALAGDIAGYPNGRRPGDDVVDIALRAVMGALLDPTCAPDGALPYTDGAYLDATAFDNAFPYLRTPLPGSPR